MKHMVRVSFDGYDIPGGPQPMLESLEIRSEEMAIEEVPVLGRQVVRVTLEWRDSRLLRLLHQLEGNGVRWLEFHRDKFTDQEIEKTRLFLMLSSGECEIDGGVEWGTTYDLTQACPACGTGGRQTSALFVDGRQIDMLADHRAATTYFWHHLVDEGLAADLSRIDARGLSFRSVYAVMEDGRQKKLPCKQMIAEKTLPPMSPRKSGFGRDEQCRVCDRNGYGLDFMKAPWRFVYREVDVRDADDVNVTWENAGFARLKPNLRESLLSRPFMIVSPKVRRVFLEAGVTSFEWTPVLIDAAN